MSRVLLIVPTTTYRADDFLLAAAKLGIELVIASERPSTLQQMNPGAFLLLDQKTPHELVQAVRRIHADSPIDAVVPVDSAATLAAAVGARALGLRGNSPDAVAAALNKFSSRQRLAAAGVPQPRFLRHRFADRPAAAASQIGFPLVIKPLNLSASQGVMRADNAEQLAEQVQRLQAILQRPARRSDAAHSEYLVEAYVDGPEYSLEGLLRDGQLHLLTLFDKPDPLVGPFFEETIYVTPSSLPAEDQQRLHTAVQQGCRALGLLHGPVHAEVRMAAEGPVVIEINPRSIGGLCARTLRFGIGQISLEELILQHALRDDFGPPARAADAAGVMMIPVPDAGVLSDYGGVEQARKLTGIEGVEITAHRGRRLVPIPEGGDYLGFIFARGSSTEEVCRQLRTAHRELWFQIDHTR